MKSDGPCDDGATVIFTLLFPQTSQASQTSPASGHHFLSRRTRSPTSREIRRLTMAGDRCGCPDSCLNGFSPTGIRSGPVLPGHSCQTEAFSPPLGDEIHDKLVCLLSRIHGNVATMEDTEGNETTLITSIPSFSGLKGCRNMKKEKGNEKKQRGFVLEGTETNVFLCFVFSLEF